MPRWKGKLEWSMLNFQMNLQMKIRSDLPILGHFQSSLKDYFILHYSVGPITSRIGNKNNS